MLQIRMSRCSISEKDKACIEKLRQAVKDEVWKNHNQFTNVLRTNLEMTFKLILITELDELNIKSANTFLNFQTNELWKVWETKSIKCSAWPDLIVGNGSACMEKLFFV